MIVNLFKAITIFCEFFFMIDMLNHTASPGRQIHYAQIIPASLMCTGGVLLILRLMNPYMQHIYFVLAAGILFVSIFLREQYTLNIFLTISYTSGTLTQRFVVSNLFHSVLDPLSILTEDQMSVLIFSVLSVCLFLLSRLLIRIGKRSSFPIPYYYWWIFILIQSSVFVLLLLGEQTLISDYSFQYLTLTAAVYAFVLAVSYLLSRISSDFGQMLEQSMSEQQASLQTSHLEDAKEFYSELRKLRHELKNNFFYLETLLESEDYQAAKEYLKQISQLPDKLEQMADTGNPTVNAILNSKAYLAATRDIPFQISGSLPEQLSISPSDLFGLLSNILDNALENVNVDAPNIAVKTEIIKAYFSVTVTNSVKESVLSANPLLKTTKRDHQIHGYGMKVIRSITEKYSGILDYREDNNEFTISILLKLP